MENKLKKENEYLAMDVLSEDQKETMLKAIRTIDRHLTIEEINYKTGYIKLGYEYEDFVKDDFMKVNVGAESVGCMMWEVINAVFKRCM